MKNIKIYGHSDDCICVSGDMQDEGYANSDGTGFVELSTGDVFEVKYTKEGVWRISRIQEGNPAADINLIPCVYDEENEDESGYTDQMYLVGQITDINFWSDWPPARRELLDKIETLASMPNCTPEQLRQIYNILRKAGHG